MKLGKRVSFLMILISLVFGQKGEFNYSLMNYGDESIGLSARALGMGNSGLAAGDVFSAMYMNPSAIAYGAGAFTVSGGLMMNMTEEDRSFPYYDSFGGFTDYGSYFYNRNWYPGFYGSVTALIPNNYMPGLTFGLGYYPFLDFSYDYLEAVGQPNTMPDNRKDKLLGHNSIISEGKLYVLPFAAAVPVPFYEKVKIGLQAGWVHGIIKYREAVEPFPEMFPDGEAENIRRETTMRRKMINNPLIGTLGITYEVNERLSLAAVGRSPYQVKFESRITDTDINGASIKTIRQILDYPMRIGAGLAYQFENILAARIHFDVVYEFWEDFKDNKNEDLDYNNTYKINTGIEHVFVSKVPLRAGFSYQILREDKNFSKALISLGSGFDFRDIRVDIGGGISFLEYNQQDLFNDSIYGLIDRTDADKVSVTNLFTRIDVNYAF
ncbi:MAG: hypothetical protein JXR46_04515 [Calditrichaceae bacterium]|nr:hypothetical protein [Calditrichaceae bacterium]MBN2708290.1 hypothetical protein [Calditrichaceae bacterium]RQV91932.1 MAG: hypothetical protein EH224_17025 [Calditrichota bacterium]